MLPGVSASCNSACHTAHAHLLMVLHFHGLHQTRMLLLHRLHMLLQLVDLQTISYSKSMLLCAGKQAGMLCAFNQPGGVSRDSQKSIAQLPAAIAFCRYGTDPQQCVA